MLFLAGAGVALLLHAGWSAVHFQRLAEEHYGEATVPLPIDVYVELLAAAALCLLGATASIGTFTPVYAESEAPHK